MEGNAKGSGGPGTARLPWLGVESQGVGKMVEDSNPISQYGHRARGSWGRWNETKAGTLGLKTEKQGRQVGGTAGVDGDLRGTC